MAFESGAELLHYRLVERLGQGGMGVVWRAVDPSLEREVAIKVLPEAWAADPDRCARFEREARTLASLNHPNIATVHGFHEVDGTYFLAMELVEGEDLAARLQRGPLRIDETVEVGLSIAAALEAAHDRGIVHRDLKPANVIWRPGGACKVLDFGLALSGGGDPGSSHSHSPTMTTPATLEGSILGTAAYMSPEQARGRAVDRRTDLWAFGCVLFECLTARRAFAGETVSDTLAAILRGEPDWDALPASTPPTLRDLMRRCLTKPADGRWRDAGDAGVLLGEADGPEIDTAVPARSWSRTVALVVGALLLGGMLGTAFSWRGGSRDAVEVIDASLPWDSEWMPTSTRLSPDGSVVGVIGYPPTTEPNSGRLWLRAVDGRFEHRLDVPVVENEFRFSPDSTQVAFISSGIPGLDRRGLMRAPVDGSAPAVLVAPWGDDWGDSLAWLSDAELVVPKLGGTELVRLPLDGRPNPAPVRTDLSGTRRVVLHETLPDGQLLATAERWAGGYHQDAIVLDPGSGASRTLIERAIEPAWIDAGYLAFTRSEQLLVAPYRPGDRGTVGPVRAVASGLLSDLELTAARFGMSRRGDLVYKEGGIQGDRRRLVRVARDGRVEEWPGSEQSLATNGIDDSQDGRVIAVTRISTNNLFEVWASEIDSGTAAFRRTVAFVGADCYRPVVSTTGRWIAAECYGIEGENGVYVAAFPPTGEPPRRVIASDGPAFIAPLSWSQDETVLFFRRRIDGSPPIWRVPIEEGAAAGEPLAVEGLGPEAFFLAPSPDNRWVVVVEDVVGANTWFVAPWDGARIGAPLPLGETSSYASDWISPPDAGASGYSLVFSDARGTGYSHLPLDADGRPGQPVPLSHLPIARSTLGSAILADGSAIRILADPDELVVPRIRFVSRFGATWQQGD